MNFQILNILQGCIGGDLEVINGLEDYHYCGRIKTVGIDVDGKVIEGQPISLYEEYDLKLVVELEWMARFDDENSFWVRDKNLLYEINLGALKALTKDDKGRFMTESSSSHERLLFIPPACSALLLDPKRIRGLERYSVR